MKNFLLKQVTIIFIPSSVVISPLMMGLNTVHIWSWLEKCDPFFKKHSHFASRRPLQIKNQIIIAGWIVLRGFQKAFKMKI